MKKKTEEVRVIRPGDRYQFQPWHVKLYRWLRYTPLAFIIAAQAYLTYPNKVLRKKDVSRTLWAELHFIEARSGMDHWYTMEEVFSKRKR